MTTRGGKGRHYISRSIGERTAYELVDHPFVLHELEQLPDLRIFGPRSLYNRDVLLIVVPKDLCCGCDSRVILLVEMRPVQG